LTAGIALTEPPAVQQLGSAVLLQGQALTDAYYLVSAGIREASRSGYPTGRFEEIRRAIRDASRRRQSDVAERELLSHSGNDRSAVDTIGTAEAAALLGIGFRNCQRKAKEGLGRRVGGRWVYDRALVIAEAERRKERQ
jgi:hypothetical protein